MAHHVVLLEHAPTPGETLRLAGDEAHHALRVRRLASGDRLALRDGRGFVGVGVITGSGKHAGEWTLDVRVDEARTEPPQRPALHVLAAPPKGERLAEMIDGLSQVGAASWGPLRTTRTVVDPREGKLERLGRVARESLKQCGRAWTLAITPGAGLADLPHRGVIVADASGQPYAPRGDAELTLLIGPEGGFTPEELAALRAAGAHLASFGRHTLRTESAAVVAAGIIMHLEGGTNTP